MHIVINSTLNLLQFLHIMGSMCSCITSDETPEPERKKSIKPPSLSISEEISSKSFKSLKLLGKGNFGNVYLVAKKDTNEYFAMKVLKKKLIESSGQKAHTLSERKVLEACKSPFICKLHYAFQTSSKLYMVMELLSGGELFFHLSQQGLFSEIRTKFYVGEILLGIEYLHSNGIIYRDLKPENVLLDHEGHVRLTDFGLSKQEMHEKSSKAYTFCGTAEYLAPEILMSQGYTVAVDFWSLGALMYYMLSGAPPFYSTNKSQIFKNVMTKQVEPLLNVTEEANDLLLKLLQIDVRFI